MKSSKQQQKRGKHSRNELELNRNVVVE